MATRKQRDTMRTGQEVSFKDDIPYDLFLPPKAPMPQFSQVPSPFKLWIYKSLHPLLKTAFMIQTSLKALLLVLVTRPSIYTSFQGVGDIFHIQAAFIFKAIRPSSPLISQNFHYLYFLDIQVLVKLCRNSKNKMHWDYFHY